MKIFTTGLLALLTSVASLGFAQGESNCTTYQIQLSTEMWANEVSWSLLDATGTAVASGQGTSNYTQQVQTVCLADGCYLLQMEDSFGDGWNGATWNLAVELPNGTWEVIGDDVTLPSGHSGSWAVALPTSGADCGGWVWGCTDAAAPNFNPAANVNDGSCMLPCDCTGEPEAPVCAYDPITGGYETFPNACTAACWGAYVAWNSDCSVTPSYGCTDPAALNFDADANMDDGGCQYLPTCGSGEELTVFRSISTAPDGGWGLLSWVVYAPTGASVPVSAWYDNNNELVEYHCLASECHTVVVYGSFNSNGALEVTVGESVPTLWTLPAGESTGTLVLAVGGATDCVAFLPGCTDPTALNFNPQATQDDGSCAYPASCDGGLLASFYLCTFSNGAHVALSLADEAGNVVYEQEGYNNVAIVYEDLCLAPGCYTATMTNVGGGTGWYGGYWTLNLGGLNIVHTALAADSVSQTVTFAIGAGGCGEAPVTGGQPFEFPEPIALVAWPNPTGGEWVEFTGSGWDAQLPVVVQIRDLTGRLQVQREIPAGADASFWRFSVADWANGLYLVEAVQGNQWGRTRFMRTH